MLDIKDGYVFLFKKKTKINKYRKTNRHLTHSVP